MNRVRLVMSLLTIATLAACSDAVSPGSAKSALDANREKWNAQRLNPYTFTLNQLCFCAINGPVRVVVANGSVVSATQISTGQALDTRFVSTIESLFDFIEQGIANHSAVLEATYDPALGYPVRIVSHGPANVTDDGVTYDVTDVGPIAR